MVALLNTYINLLNEVESAEDNSVWIDECTSDPDILKSIEGALVNKDINEMTSLLIALDDFEKRRKVKDSILHRDYRLWQAVWASKYDKLEGRMPVITDPYIRFPFPKGEENNE